MPLEAQNRREMAHFRYFIDSTGLLHRNQHGFQTGKSTGSAIFNYTKELYSVLDNNHLSISTYIDYKKAIRKTGDVLPP